MITLFPRIAYIQNMRLHEKHISQTLHTIRTAFHHTSKHLIKLTQNIYVYIYISLSNQPTHNKTHLNRFVHCILQQRTGNLNRNDLSIRNAILDQFTEFRARTLTLLAQQITGGQMHIAELIDDLRALCSLSGAGSTKDEYNLWLFAGHDVRVNGAKQEELGCCERVGVRWWGEGSGSGHGSRTGWG